MAYVYRPRGMPRRFFEGAPDVVRRGVLDIIGPFEHAVCAYDVVLRPEPGDSEVAILDFGPENMRGAHSFLKPHEARAYRERNRRKRVAWLDLPEPTRAAIVAYLEWNPDA
jgi:hypothetical protein